MSTKPQPSLAPRVDAAEVRRTLERVLASKYFVNAHKKKGFLRLICELYVEGRAQEVNEYRIAFDVFGRDSSYNPSADPIVRVVAHEIRKKLELYYQHEGASDELRLEIPAGSYQPIFTRREVAARGEGEAGGGAEARAEPAPASPPDALPARRSALTVPTLLAALVLLAAGVAYLGVSNLDMRRQLLGADASPSDVLVGPVWAPFAKDQTPPLVILSNPPVLGFANASDPDAAVKDAIPLPPEAVEALREKFVVVNPEVVVTEPGATPGAARTPAERAVRSERVRLVSRTNVYTGMGEAIGLHYLTDFFRAAGRAIQLKQSRTLSAEDLKNHNVIMLGGVWVNEWAGKLAYPEDFVFTDNATIVNHAPREGEAHEYIPEYDGRSGALLVDYALITVKPNLSSANEVMVLAGISSPGTEAAVEMVTTRSYLEQLNQRLEAVGAGRAPYFQALLKVGVENGIPTTVTVLAVHELAHFEPSAR